jgi:hypothetical protein
MARAHREYTIVLSVLGILVAIGIPSLQRGQSLKGWICIALAGTLLIWWLVEEWRYRR